MVLPPPKSASGKPPVAFIMLPGPGFTATQYTSVVSALQAAAAGGHAMWAGIAAGSDAGSPATTVPRVLAAMSAQGFPSSNSGLFLGSHSPQRAANLLGYAASSNVTAGIKGLVLMGGFITRAHRGTGAGGAAFSMPVLTLAGELDGVVRLTRAGAEAFYTQITRASNPSAAAVDFPVVVVPGAAHMSFATGTATATVLDRDLTPTATAAAAQSFAGTQVASFVGAHAAASPSAAFLRGAGADAAAAAAASALRAAVRAAAGVLQPIVAAMAQEGSHRLHAVCNSDFPTNAACQYPAYPNKTLIGPPKPAPSPLPPPDCICGSQWVMQVAQSSMAGFAQSAMPNTKAVVADAFHDVSDVSPFHLPHIWSNCTAGSAGCVINATTVTMPIYEDGAAGASDDGLAPLSAFEFRTKLKSRQAMWQAAGMAAPHLNATDGNLTMCRAINQAALDWAMAQASPSARARFAAVGEPLVMVDDVVAGFGITGPQWIKDAMKYTRVPAPKHGAASTAVQVQSWTFDTQNYNKGNVPFWITAGYHYCKLLSPFRAMEWITVDGLRQYGSLANATATSTAAAHAHAAGLQGARAAAAAAVAM